MYNIHMKTASFKDQKQHFKQYLETWYPDKHYEDRSLEGHLTLEILLNWFCRREKTQIDTFLFQSNKFIH